MLPDDDGFTPMSFARANGFDELSKKLQIFYDHQINGDIQENKDEIDKIEKDLENFNVNSCD